MAEISHDQKLCPICNSNNVRLLDVVDFNKYCTHDDVVDYELAGIPIYYSICKSCNFVYAKDIYSWSYEDFRDKIYNDEYIKYDGEYLEVRPRQNFKFIKNLFDDNIFFTKHLDYGGGNGRLVELMNENGFPSTNYEPFEDGSPFPNDKFDFITAFEVLEHVPNPAELFEKITQLITHSGIFLFSTQINDGNITSGKRLSWWYAGPRNGHISLFSQKSLSIAAKKYGFHFGSIDNGVHVFTMEKSNRLDSLPIKWVI